MEKRTDLLLDDARQEVHSFHASDNHIDKQSCYWLKMLDLEAAIITTSAIKWLNGPEIGHGLDII